MNIASSSQTTASTSPSSKIATTGSHCYVLHSSSKKHTWVIDTGATDHMTFVPGQINSHTPSSQSVVSNANGTPLPNNWGGFSLSLSDSLTLDSVLIDILSSKTIGCGTRRGKLYYLDLASDCEASLNQTYKITGVSVEKHTSEVWLWHRHLGHASFGYLQKLFPSLFSKLDISSFKCDICELAKSHRVPFPLSSHKSLVPFSLVHSDVWGLTKITTPWGAQWFVTFIDDCTRMTWVSLLTTKGEVSSKFQQFYQMVETQFHTRIQVLRSDNGGEFLNHDLNQFLQDHDIIHQSSCPHTPQQNGVAERKNRYLLEVVRASLFGAKMPRPFWGEAVLSATYIINRIPSSILNFQSPIQTLHHHLQIPHTLNLEPRIFGCVVFVHLHHHQRSKLDPRAKKCLHWLCTSLERENDIYFSVAQVEHCDPNTSQNSDFLFPDTFQTESNQSPVGSDRSPVTLPESDRSLPGHQTQPVVSSPCCPTQEEETYEILPAPETSSDLVPHQAPAEDVI
ncbi:unnamed protein product [Prunus armeniaca]